jgi:fatty-acyl-CoA synthase
MSVIEPSMDAVLDVVAELAREVGGERAARAVTPSASLEREVGLGSLERVELLLRLERATGRALDEGVLGLDTCGEIHAAVRHARARATVEAESETGPEPVATARPRRLTQLAAPAATLHETLLRWSEQEPDREHVQLPEEQAPADRMVSFERLRQEAGAVAAALNERGLRPGDRVGLMLPTGLDFLACFQGALWAGAVPVPIYPPVRLDRLEEYAERQATILADAGARLLVAIGRARAVAHLLKSRVPTLEHVVTASELRSVVAAPPAPASDADATALIQYTSGSTGSPKGVTLTHRQLLANVEAIATGLALQPTDVGVSWLPLYHDMGLIGAWLMSLVRGMPLVLLSPLSFLARPERWLREIHVHRATLSPAPNFAYELCVRKIPEAALADLDLSSWRCALNGAEAVSPDTLDRFVARFGRCGFRRETFMPVYGLAENAVALCFPPVGRGPLVDTVERRAFERDGRALPAKPDSLAPRRFVSVGSALPLHAVRIVDDADREVGDRVVGRIVFRGPSAMVGYFGRPGATEAVTLPGGWRDSGDLGYRADGELFVTGRSKDIIVKGGRNLVPDEIEEAAGKAEGVRRGRVAAFGLPNEDLGTEALVVVAETRENDAAARDRMTASIIERVSEAIGAPPDSVLLVPPHAVPKTPSGKIRRSATRELFVAGSLGPPPSLPWRLRARLALAGLTAVARPRDVVRAVYGAWVGLVCVVMIAAMWPLALLLPAGRPVRLLSRLGSRVLLWLLGCRTRRTRTEGVTSLPRPLIVACNHSSYVDIPALLATLPFDFRFVAKREVLRWPFIGTLARRGQHLAVEREETTQSVNDAATVSQAVAEGVPIVFFPEGTFTATVGVRPFRLGAFKAAADAHCPVLPVALHGVRAILRSGQRIPRPRPIRLWIGPLAPAPDDGTFRDLVAFRDRIAATITAECGEPPLAMATPAPYLSVPPKR